MNELPQEIGLAVKNAREARGLTQKQLADAAGIGKTAVFDLEHGNEGVRLRTLLAVFGILDLSLSVQTPQPAVTQTVPDDLPPAPAVEPSPVEDLPAHLL